LRNQPSSPLCACLRRPKRVLYLCSCGWISYPLTGLGCDIAQKAVVVVKSMQHFRAGFDAVAGSVLYAAAPGASSPDLSTLPFTKARRTIWPLTR